MRRVRLDPADLDPADLHRLEQDLAPVLGVVCSPVVRVEVDIAVGERRLRSWQGRVADRIAALSTAGADVEVSWGPDSEWQAELARAVRVGTLDEPEPESEGESAGRSLEVPHEVLLGAGVALAEHRDDALRELAARHGLDPDLVRRLHTEARGRMRTVVRTTRAVAWVTWVLYDDGWHAFTPFATGGVPTVRVARVTPATLGVEVARLVMETAA